MKKTIALLSLIAAATASAELVARYSFTENLSDSVGTHDGQLQGTARIADNQLVLDGEGWAELPGGLVTELSSATIEFWTTDQQSATWARIYDFGNTHDGLGANCWYFTPNCPAGARTTFSNTDPGYKYEETIDTAALQENVLTHVAVVYDGSAKTARLYINGKRIGETAMTVKLSDIGTEHLYLGKSSYDSDPLFKGSITEFRIYDAPLSEKQIQLNSKQGPDAL